MGRWRWLRPREVQLSFAALELDRQGIQPDPALRRISDFPDAHPELSQRVQAALLGGLKRPQTGRRGLTGAQALRAWRLGRLKNWPCRALRRRIAEGDTLRQLTGCGARAVPKADAFQRSFWRVRPDPIRQINDALIQAAVAVTSEDGSKLRGDTAVVASDLPYPTDRTLWWDGVRTISRLRLAQLAPKRAGVTTDFPARRRRMQELSRMRDRRGKHERSFRRTQRDLLTVAAEVTARARGVIGQARRMPGRLSVDQLLVDARGQEIRPYTPLTEQLIDQTRRRVCADAAVPAEQQLDSRFEPHTDLLKRGKARKPVEFGHKVLLAESRVGLITAYRVLRGTPADSDQVAPSLEHHQPLFARAPTLDAAGRGFDHPAARALAESTAVAELGIPQRGGKLSAARTAPQHSRQFKAGPRYRAGIEGTIPVLRRGRGLRRCLLEGPLRFELRVGAAVLAANFLRLATLRARRAPKRKPLRPLLARAA